MTTFLEQARQLIQQDVGQRGLATHTEVNLFSFCAGDLEAACHSLASASSLEIAIVTGFFIPDSTPPAGETDGPPGTLYLARALAPLGAKVHIVTDDYCLRAFEVALQQTGLQHSVALWTVAQWEQSGTVPTHLIAIERAGPNHTLSSITAQGHEESFLNLFQQLVSEANRDQCFTMRGRNITERMGFAHRLFERPDVTTIGIGDGGNEIGMGKIPWSVIHQNIPGGGLVACRASTDHLLVCGVSNWGAYALALGCLHLRGVKIPSPLLDLQIERELLELMVREGPLVDGVKGRHEASVDGLSWDQYIAPLRAMAALLS